MTETTMTWREWINQYDPVEIVIEFSGYNPLSIQSVVLQWKTPVANMTGVASGNEWRSKDGRWYMRGEPINRGYYRGIDPEPRGD